MTQKQTDYDKALNECRRSCDRQNAIAAQEGVYFDLVGFAFQQGYEYGKKLTTTDHDRNLIAHGDEYMTASVEAQEKGFKDWENNPYKRDTKAEAYKQGWADADTFDSAWLDSYPEDAFQRILDNHPEIIENEVKARMKDLENEAKKEIEDFCAFKKCPKISQNVANCDIDHFRDSTKMMRYEIAMMAVPALIQKLAWGKDYRRVSQIAVNFADALIKELEKGGRMKTIEEAAEEYADRYQGIRRNEAYDAFNAGAEYALANQWVSVEDDMPESGLLVIVRDEDGDFNAARWNADLNVWQCEHSQMVWFRTTVTHWMPIPELKIEE